MNERIMCLKVLIGDNLLTLHMRLKQVEAERRKIVSVINFHRCDHLVSMIGSIPASELIVVVGSVNRHNGRNVDAYNGLHVRQRFRESIADGERLLRFCNAIEFTVTQRPASACRRIN